MRSSAIASSSYSPPQPPATQPSPHLPLLALVIPTLREAGNLAPLLARIQTTLDAASIPCEILVVDDDSRDGTAELVTALALHDLRIRLLVRTDQRGLSGAILHGWQHTQADLLGVIDADLQHPPEMLPALIAAILHGSDVAIASRYAPAGRPGDWNPIRRLVSAAAIALTRPLQRPATRVHDPMSGFFLVRRRCVQNVMFQPTGFKLLLEILVRGHVNNIAEIPFAFGRRRAGRSKATLPVAWDYLRLLARLYALPTRTPAILPKESSGD